MKKFISLSLLLIAGRIFDVTTTYLYTPDLKNETNVVVKLFGAGWTSVLIIQILIVGLVIYLLNYYFFKFKPAHPADKNLTKKQFSSFLFFGDTNSFDKIFYSIPKNRNALLASTGYVASMTLIIVSFIVGASTTMLLISDGYRQLYRQGIPYLLYALIVGVAIWFTLNFFRKEYNAYQNRN